jgi:hypothetical protein
MSVHVSGCASGVLSGEARQVAPAKTLTLPPALPRLTRTARDGPTVAARWERSVDQGNARGKGHIEGRWGERIVGLEGARTTPAFLQRHGHARLELIRLLSPEYEGRLRHAPANPPVSARFRLAPSRTTGLRARCAEFVRELERYHDSYRLCDVRGPRASGSGEARRLANASVRSRLSLGRSRAPEKSRQKGSIASSA